MTAIALFTFVFFAQPFTGKTVVDMTEAHCRELEVDASRVLKLGVGQSKVGMCIRQK